MHSVILKSDIKENDPSHFVIVYTQYTNIIIMFVVFLPIEVIFYGRQRQIGLR